MSKQRDDRKPAAFRLDDPHVVVAPPVAGSDEAAGDAPRRAKIRGSVMVTPAPEPPIPATAAASASARRRISWGSAFWASAGALCALGLGLAVTQLIEALFARGEWLGLLGSGFAALAILALTVVAIREAVSLAHLRRVEALRLRAEAAIADDDRHAAQAVVRDLLNLTRSQPRLARSRLAIAGHLDDIIDGADLVRLAERELMAPLDHDACVQVTAAAKRVSLVTAVNPRAAVDMIFVFVTALGLVRRLAEIYGGRPGMLGLVRLVRHVVAHLAVTGGIAVGDSVIQQMVGHGVAAKISARLGEGVLNGLLTARLGLAAIEAARPLPFAALERPALSDLASGLLRRPAQGDGTVAPPGHPPQS